MTLDENPARPQSARCFANMRDTELGREGEQR
jgi:hypothetical protein